MCLAENISDQIDCFWRELKFYVEMTHVEQVYQLSEKLPSVEEYQQRRMGSSAVGPCLALTEYAPIPSYMMLH
jgi:Terpene synthase family 2, C-terminal metal binding